MFRIAGTVLSDITSKSEGIVMSHGLWGGRFDKDLAQDALEFSSSFPIDQVLWPYDIMASRAHVSMLASVGIISRDEGDEICTALDVVGSEFKSEGFPLRARGHGIEDIHSEIEFRLREKIGELAGKVHTARSRNDQVLVAMVLYVRNEVSLWKHEIRSLQFLLKNRARKTTEWIMPGLTHTQHAQPISLAHHLMAYYWMLNRDLERLADLSKRLEKCPLGACALGGTSFPIDREQVAKELGFQFVTENSLDTVSDRDFILETVSVASISMGHLSRMAEDLILWSTPEFGFVTLDDTVTTGSSIMPNKKNPDMAELVRGKCAAVYGDLMTLLTLMKGMPLGYHRDFQEDKGPLFRSLKTAQKATRIMKLNFESLQFHQHSMEERLKGDFSNATDVADYLTSKGMPFREAHGVVGRLVADFLSQGMTLECAKFEDFQKHSSLFEMDILEKVSHRAVFNARNSEGGSSPLALARQFERSGDFF